MEINKVVTNLIKALQSQGFSFEGSIHSGDFEKQYDYLTGAKKAAFSALESMTNHLVSYDEIDKKAFAADYNRFQKSVDDRVLFTWAYNSGTLSIVGILGADDLSDGEIRSIFQKLDIGVVNIMKAHVGKSNGYDAGTYGTLLLVFEDQRKAQRFNANIRDYYESHSIQKTYVSTMSIDCKSEVLTRGKAPLLFFKWAGGIDVSSLKDNLFKK